jgi:hypothetical protein
MMYKSMQCEIYNFGGFLVVSVQTLVAYIDRSQAILRCRHAINNTHLFSRQVLFGHVCEGTYVSSNLGIDSYLSIHDDNDIWSIMVPFSQGS